MYVKIKHNYQLVIILYVDDIIFDDYKDEICKEFANKMQNEFEMYMVGELSYFLVLQVNQLDKGIFISQIKYVKEMLKKFNMEDSKPVSTSMMTSYKLCKEVNSSHLIKLYIDQ